MLHKLNPRWIRATVALGVAFLLWFSVKLMRRYEVTPDIPLAYDNMPRGLTFRKALPRELRVRLAGEGHQLLLPSLGVGYDSLSVDIDQHLGKGYFVTATLRERIRERYPNTVQVLSISPDTIHLEYLAHGTKRVPLLPRFNIRPDAGYWLAEPPRMMADSVTLTGEPDSLFNVWAWATVDTTLVGIQNVASYRVRLEERPGIVPSQQTVGVSARAKRFVGAQRELPVRVYRPPLNAHIRVVPTTVKVHCLVPFEGYEVARLQDMRVVADFSELHPGQRYVVPRVLNVPPGVIGVRVEPAHVLFLISEEL
jgi:hypothetical protein